MYDGKIKPSRSVRIACKTECDIECGNHFLFHEVK